MSAGTSDLVSVTSELAVDLTRGTEYDKLVHEEIEHYSVIEVKEDLTEGGVHGHKAWGYNYTYLCEKFFRTSFWDEVVAHANRHESPRLLSLGCGYGGVDLQVARKLRRPHELIAVDLNPGLFREAERRARSEGLNIIFKCVDLNFAEIQPDSFDVVYAFASLHHVLNLEHLLGMIHRGLRDGGRLVILDLIGKSQVLHWKENVEFAAELVRTMPRRFRPGGGSFWQQLTGTFDPYTIIPRYVEPTEQIGMEGIRQEEIERLLEGWFTPEKVLRYNAFMRLIGTNPYLGHRLDPERDDDCRLLESFIETDWRQVQSGRLRPTEILAVYAKKPSH